MVKLARVLASVFAASVSGYAGLLFVAIFGPLLFPATLTGSSPGETAVEISAMAALLLFGGAGWVLCWKFTKRFVKQEEMSIRSFTDFPDR